MTCKKTHGFIPSVYHRIRDETLDIVMLVQHLSRTVFLKMANDPQYFRGNKFREGGLERAMLYARKKSDKKAFFKEIAASFRKSATGYRS